jgi:hypothetical protein
MPTRVEKAKAKIREALRRYVPLLERARRRNINEADTCGRVYDMLQDILGYDKYLETTSEYRVRGQYVDYAIKIDGEVKFFIEVKAVGVTLNPNHLRQVTTYAVDEGVEWAVLTNACLWQLYHIGFERPINVQLVAEADLLAKDHTAAVDLLYLISRDGITRDEAAKYWSTKLALSAPNLVKVLLNEGVLNKMRRELRQMTGQRLSPDELRALLVSQVLSAEAAQAAGVKVTSRARKRRGRSPKKAPSPLPAVGAEGGEGER